MSDNLAAFLTMIAVSEGTQGIPNSDNGYRVIVGSTAAHPILMDGYADHPRRLVQLRPGLSSTAAGRYQILERFYDAYKAELHLSDFSPRSQDLIATQMISEHRALTDVLAGNISDAVIKCAPIWASLPGAGYGQHENALAALLAAYVDSDGRLA